MSKIIPQISTSTDTFGIWVQRTNDILNELATTIVTASVSGDSTIGNASLVGSFDATNLTAATLLRTNTIDTKVGSSAPIEIKGVVNVTNSNQLSHQLKNTLGPRVRIANDNIAWHAGLRGSAGSGTNAEYIIAVEGGSMNYRFGADGTFYANNIIITSDPSDPLSIVRADRLIAATNGITGGGDLSANRTLSLIGNALGIHSLSANGIVTKTSSGTMVSRTLSSGSGVLVTNPTGQAGNPSFAVDATVIRTTGAQTVGGTKSFTNSIIEGDITTNNHVVINDNMINSSQLFDGLGSLAINFETDFNKVRDFEIYNGNGGIISKFLGSDRSFITGYNTDKQTKIIENQINASPDYAGIANLNLNVITSTLQFRNVMIYDGKDNKIAQFIGTTGNFSAYGNVTAHGNIRQTSDSRLKHNIEPITDALNKVMQIEGVNFNYNKTGLRSLGVIAQQIEQVIPEAVTEGEDGIKTVSYGNLVGLLIEAIKDLKLQIDDLKK